MTISKTTQSELTGQSLIDAKAKVWFLSLRLWMWKNQPHLRERPVWNTEVVNEIEHFEPEIKFKHVYAIPVWDIDMNYISYYMLFTRHKGYPLGRVRDLRYLLDASKTKV